VLLGIAVVTAIAAASRHAAPPARPIGLFTTLPILWRETPDLAGLLATDAPPHWAREAIARHGSLRALDTLAGKDGRLPLPVHALLIMAQPRPLSPDENVALDDWVRGGGHLLLFADPMLTGGSAFALGDRRRPQDVVLLSPILARWGLTLQFDDGQAYGMREIRLMGAAIPVNLPGRFAAPGDACALSAEDLVARCRIGAGTVIAIADAALIEDGTDGDDAPRSAMLDRLLGAFPD